METTLNKVLDKPLDKTKNLIFMEAGKAIKKGLLTMPIAESLVVKVLGVLGRLKAGAGGGNRTRTSARLTGF
jgi:hypothetical protein